MAAPVRAPAPIAAQPTPQEEAFTLPSMVRQDAAAVLAQHINQAIQQKQWQHLPTLLAAYRAHPQADPGLILYARGILSRMQKDYAAAIDAYTALLQMHPALPYVRLDLALMQAEDKQYAAAIQTLEGLLQAPQTPVPLRALAHGYLERLHAVYAPDLRVSATFTRNDNVNQASAERTVQLFGLTFVKAEDSLPKVGHGVNYGVQVQKLFAIQGHHGVSLSARYRGVHYWDQHDYSERTLRFEPSYLYQSYRHRFKIGPVWEKNWLAAKPYGTRRGAQLEWVRTLSEQHSVIPYAEYARKRYAAPALRRYEGNDYRTGVTWLYQPRDARVFWLGLEHHRDVLVAKDESSTNVSMRLGGRVGWGNLNVQVNAQIGRRRFDTEHLLFGIVRKDHERTASIGLWHSQFSFLGITPKLVFNWRTIRSNIPALYSRKSQGMMVEIAEMVF